MIMDSIELEIEIEYGQQKRRERYDQRNSSRRAKHLQKQLLAYPDLLLVTHNQKQMLEQTITVNDEALYETSICDHDEHNESNSSHLMKCTSHEQEETPDYETNNLSCNIYDKLEPIEPPQSHDHDDDLNVPLILPLHNYTTNSTFDYCENFVFLARQAGLSKQHTNDLLAFIKSGLPVPNNMPSTEKKLLSMLGVQELFTKRCICLLCCLDFDYSQKMCPRCCSTSKTSIAYVYDANIELIIKNIIKRLNVDINEYRNKININYDEGNTKDIPFGTLYQDLLKKNNYQNMISMLLHVDGINITRSSKLKMWMLSSSIVELLPKLRSQRSNMVLISIWIGYVEPIPNLWLGKAVHKLEDIKTRGINVMNKNHKLIIFGVTGDCPAISLICNFINHNGYYSCWFCFIKGLHIINKRQYRYESKIVLREVQQYLASSKEAERTHKNINGHLGQCILETILDIALPHAIVPDYLHVTLLGHVKTIARFIYHQLKPIQREQLNIQLKTQAFPHFFNRKLRSMDDFAFIKGTELRNLLFYGLLPNLNLFLSNEQLSHLAMYVCAIRLFHSGHIFGKETYRIAERLFCKFYQDHELFYTQLQSLKLHIHCHYSSMYESHGSLCHLGCFGQENFIGFVSSNHHGTRYFGDSITHYYNIDFCIQNKKESKRIIDGPRDPSATLANDYDCLIKVHSIICGCNNINSCCVIYRRFVIHRVMFHSLIYNRRQNSISYFVHYTLGDNVIGNRFGKIELFFVCQNIGYAVIKYHRVKDLYSNTFINSSYYQLLREPLDSLYYVLEKNHSAFDVVRVDYIISHCVIVEKYDYLFVTNILSYDEHD